MNNNNTPRSPTLVESLLPILAMILLLGFGYAAFDLPPEPLMVLSTVIAALLVKRLGYGYNAILESISQKIAKTMPALLILISVGLLIGTWMIGGTIPLMIYYGLNLIVAHDLCDGPARYCHRFCMHRDILGIRRHRRCCVYGCGYRNGG